MRTEKRGVWDKAYVTYTVPGRNGCIEIAPFIYPSTSKSLEDVRQFIAQLFAVSVEEIILTNWFRMSKW